MYLYPDNIYSNIYLRRVRPRSGEQAVCHSKNLQQHASWPSLRPSNAFERGPAGSYQYICAESRDLVQTETHALSSSPLPTRLFWSPLLAHHPDLAPPGLCRFCALRSPAVLPPSLFSQDPQLPGQPALLEVDFTVLDHAGRKGTAKSVFFGLSVTQRRQGRLHKHDVSLGFKMFTPGAFRNCKVK